MTLNEELRNDAVPMQNHPVGICQPEPAWDDSKPLIVILASCHGRTLLTYFDRQPDFRSKYNIVRLETGPIHVKEITGEPVMTRPSIAKLLCRADILLTYNMGVDHGSYSMENIRKQIRSDCKVITFTAPNCSLFWPVAYGYLGDFAVMHAFDTGKTAEQIIHDFYNGTFDPMFKMRWRLEIGRLEHKDISHDVKLAPFVVRNHVTHKLFMGPSHPTFTTVAWLGSEIIRLLGYASETEAQVLAHDHNINAMGPFPETHYEFNHFGFTYPMRHQHSADCGGIEFYRSVIAGAWQSAFNKANFMIQTD